MKRYCIAKVDLGRHINFGEARFFAKLRDGVFGWVDCLLDKSIIWYDTAEEANDNLLDDDECIVSRFFPEVA